MNPQRLNKTTHDGKAVWDLDPQAGELMAIACPPQYGPEQIEAIDTDCLPSDCRWIEEEEWSQLFGVAD